MPEISDAELRVFQNAKTVLEKLTNSPKTKRDAEKLIKEHYPEVVTTDDVVEPVLSEVKALGKRFDDYINGEKGNKLDSKLAKDIDYLKSERSFTDDGIETLKKLMVSKEIPDIVVAADHWAALNPPKPQEPSILAPTDWGFGRKTEDADLKLLFEDEDAWAEKEARRAWSEESAKTGRIIT